MGSVEDKKFPRVIIKIGPEHDKLLEFLNEEIKKLSQHKVYYEIVKEPDILLPQLCVNGYCVAGKSDIKNGLKAILSSC